MATDYDFAIDVLKSGDRARLEELALLVEGFPDGVDSFMGRRWIIHAIGVGETADDLRPFDPRAVARAIAGLPPE